MPGRRYSNVRKTRSPNRMDGRTRSERSAEQRESKAADAPSCPLDPKTRLVILQNSVTFRETGPATNLTFFAIVW